MPFLKHFRGKTFPNGKISVETESYLLQDLVQSLLKNSFLPFRLSHTVFPFLSVQQNPERKISISKEGDQRVTSTLKIVVCTSVLMMMMMMMCPWMQARY
jgi:hypothetical protein